MIKMEETGPGGYKRQRLGLHTGIHSLYRMDQQQSDHTVALPLHNTPSAQAQALGPPSTYQQRLPNSPFTHHAEGRSLPDQPPHGGYNPPPLNTQLANRDGRPLAEQPPSAFSRNGSISGTPIRSPEEGHPHRPLTTPYGEAEQQQYPPHSNPEPGEQVSGPPAGYHHQEGHPGQPPHSQFHGVPMGPGPEHAVHGPPPNAAMPHYGESEMTNGPQGQPAYSQPYSAVSASSAQTWRPPSYQGAQMKRNARAQQACDNCRTRKAKCDEGRPACGYCRETNQHCVYKEVQPAKAERAHRDLMDSINQAHTNIETLGKDLHEELRDIRGLLRQIAGPSAQSRPLIRPNKLESHQEVSGSFATDEPRDPSTPKAHTDTMHDDQPMYDVPLVETNIAGELDTRSIAVDHSTGVHRLLRWHTIRDLIESHQVISAVKRKLNEDYVLQLETSKGVLRLYGRGIGPDNYDGASPTPNSPATSTASTTRSDESSRSPAPSPPDAWGVNIGPPNMIDGRFANFSTDDHPGGLNPDGTLKIDKVTMDTLFNSYLNNIHILHPFLDKTRLRRMFDKFYTQSHPSEPHSQFRSPYLFTNSITSPDPLIPSSRKRKHSPGGSPRDSSTSEPSRNAAEPLVERRISTAIVLLVMALGKICNQKDFLQGPVPDPFGDHPSGPPTSSPYSNDSPMLKASPSRVGSPVAMGVDGRTKYPRYEQSWGEGTWKGGNRNVDVIPGLAYYAKAVEILGALQGGTDLAHVQAYLLASLYMGQLGCSIESWQWISQACRNCLFLMLRKNIDKMKDEVRKQLILFAFWTCFQFEGDILAELDLKSSGCEAYTTTPFPRSVTSVEEALSGAGPVNPEEDQVIYYYSAQIIMRTTLNKIQSLLYPANVVRSKQVYELITHRDECLLSLQAWRELLPAQLQWDNDDPPADNILDARLRAKYWGTLYIIHRPLLNYAIHNRPSAESKTEIESRGIEDREVDKSCEECVFAAKQSTVAFDKIVFEGGKPKNRLIVTNIFGTAHAQFGNMLVLAAVYKSSLNHLIDKNELVHLMNRTILFLTKLSPISDTLRTDAYVLRGILTSIDPTFHPTTSFSSC